MNTSSVRGFGTTINPCTSPPPAALILEPELQSGMLHDPVLTVYVPPSGHSAPLLTHANTIWSPDVSIAQSRFIGSSWALFPMHSTPVSIAGVSLVALLLRLVPFQIAPSRSSKEPHIIT